MVKILGDKIA